MWGRLVKTENWRFAEDLVQVPYRGPYRGLVYVPQDPDESDGVPALTTVDPPAAYNYDTGNWAAMSLKIKPDGPINS